MSAPASWPAGIDFDVGEGPRAATGLGLTVAQVQPGIWAFTGLAGEATGTFLAYHGSHRWESPAEIRPLRKGHAEHGPGIYFTTGYETAAKYAKGGGSVGLFTLAAPRAWAHQASLDPGEVEAFLKGLRGLKGRPGLLADVKRIIERMKGKVPAESLVNLFVSSDQASGQTGVELARFLVEHGVDALYVPNAAGRDEEWFVLLNPKLVLSRQAVSPKGEIVWDLPL